MKDKRTVCIYHGGCLDGFTSAWIVNGAIPNAEFISGHYDDHIDLHNLEDANVIFVDFSAKRPQMIDIANVANSVLVLDHHESALKELEGLDKAYNNMKVVFDMKRSGAAITWDYFYPTKERPHLVKTVQDRDLWKFEMAWTKEITAYMFTVEQTFKNWDNLNCTQPAELARNGEILLTKFNKDIDDLIKSCAHEVEIAGHKVMAINAPWMYASELGNKLVGDYPFALVYFINQEGKYSCSLRANGKFNCSELARTYGGGGHPNAAGFTVDSPVWCTPSKDTKKLFEVKGYRSYTGYDKVWFTVEAESKEQALQLVKDNPEEYETDSKGTDVGDSEFTDMDEWEVL